MHKPQTFGQKLKDLAQLLRIIVSVSLGDPGFLVIGLSVFIGWLGLYFLDNALYKIVVFSFMMGLGGLLMLKSTRNTGKALDSEQINQASERLAAHIPAARWVALVTDDGLVKGGFPDHTVTQPDAIAAMSAAAFSLGERISDELGGGNLRYTLIAGVSGLHLCVALSKKYVLALGLHPGVSVDAVLNTLRGSAAPIFDVLEIEQPPSWLVT